MSEVSRVSFCPFAVSACAFGQLACGAALACCLAHPAMARGIQKLPLSVDSVELRGSFYLVRLSG